MPWSCATRSGRSGRRSEIFAETSRDGLGGEAFAIRCTAEHSTRATWPSTRSRRLQSWPVTWPSTARPLVLDSTTTPDRRLFVGWEPYLGGARRHWVTEELARLAPHPSLHWPSGVKSVCARWRRAGCRRTARVPTLTTGGSPPRPTRGWSAELARVCAPRAAPHPSFVGMCRARKRVARAGGRRCGHSVVFTTGGPACTSSAALVSYEYSQDAASDSCVTFWLTTPGVRMHGEISDASLAARATAPPTSTSRSPRATPFWSVPVIKAMTAGHPAVVAPRG